MQPLLMGPEIVLFLGGLACLLAGSFLPRRRLGLTAVIAAAAAVATVGLGVVGLGRPATAAFDGTFVVDQATGVARLLVGLGVLLVLGLARAELAGSAREAEGYALLLFAATGTLVLAGAADLTVLVAGFLLASIPLYGILGLTGAPAAAEATMKAYLLGALLGIVLLSGATVLYGAGGATAYHDLSQALAQAPPALVLAGGSAVLLGLMFEAGGVPAHPWVPDAAEGSSAWAATFVTTLPKIGAILAAYRLVLMLPERAEVGLLVALLAAAGMTLGNLAALGQADPRRLLGWSTVSQVGYLLVPVAVAGSSPLALPAVLVYLSAYTMTNIAAFAVSAAEPQQRRLGDFRGVARRRPWLAAALVVALLGLLGTPPTGVFVGKLSAATAAWDGGSAWLVLVLLVNTLLSLAYYLRWLVPVYRGGEQEPRQPAATGPASWPGIVALVAAAASLLVGLGAGLLLDVVALGG